MSVQNTMVALSVGIIPFLALGDGNIALHEAFKDLSAYCVTSRYDQIESVEEWGFTDNSYSAAPFTNAVAAVSNHWQEALADWDYFATNAERRLLFRNILGFSGTNAFLGVWDGLMDIHEANPNRCSLKFIMACQVAPATPLEEFVFLNYDLPAVSNRMVRLRAFYPVDAQKTQEYFDEVMSGYRKAEIEALRSMESQPGNGNAP